HRTCSCGPLTGGPRRRWSASSTLVVRVLLVADAFILAVVGAIAALFVERPAGLFFAGGAWLFAGAPFGCLPLTHPYRPEKRGRPTDCASSAQRRRPPPPGALR